MHIHGNDFAPIPLMEVREDFTKDLKFRYLSDIKTRMNQDEYADAAPSILLRKGVKLGDIDSLIEIVRSK